MWVTIRVSIAEDGRKIKIKKLKLVYGKKWQCNRDFLFLVVVVVVVVVVD